MKALTFTQLFIYFWTKVMMLLGAQNQRQLGCSYKHKDSQLVYCHLVAEKFMKAPKLAWAGQTLGSGRIGASRLPTWSLCTVGVGVGPIFGTWVGLGHSQDQYFNDGWVQNVDIDGSNCTTYSFLTWVKQAKIWSMSWVSNQPNPNGGLEGWVRPTPTPTKWSFHEYFGH